MQTSGQSQDAVSIVELKNLARRILPSSSSLRRLILSVPDYLPKEEVAIKVRVYSRLLYRDEPCNRNSLIRLS
jgi:hypothetical protein